MARHRDPLLRHWSMLRLIPRKPRFVSTRVVHQSLTAQGYEIDLRTVQRDLQKLSLAFPFTCEEGAGPIGTVWYWAESAAALDIPGMMPAEALALVMSREQLEVTLPAETVGLLAPQFQRAEQVLAAHSGNRLASWKKRIRVLNRGPRLALPPVDREIQRVLYEAVLSGRQVFARYHGRGADEPREMKLHPYGLVVKDGIVYLVAAAWNYTGPHHYALHRFAFAELLDKPARIPAGFNLDAYIDEDQSFGYPLGLEPLPLVIDVDEGVSLHLAERPLSSDQRLSPQFDGRVRVSATVADTAELRWWLLGFGAAVEVISPPALRGELARELAAAAAAYVQRGGK